jgi:hypothetical protein
MTSSDELEVAASEVSLPELMRSNQEASEMSDPAYLNELKKYGAGGFTKSDIEALTNEYYNGPDRASAILLAALVERALETLLHNNMRKEGVNELLKSSSLLGNFGSKIQVGYAFKLFGPQTKKDLNIIRSLRNQFAHSSKPIQFVTPVVKQCCDQLIYPEAPGAHVPPSYVNNISDDFLKNATDKSHPRIRYFISCYEIAQRVFVIRGGDASDPRNHLL